MTPFFSYTQKREYRSYAQRSVVMAPRGVAASSQPLATFSGMKALAAGGNAVDAAVAMLATLSVVEPYSVGIGGDAFALLAVDGGGKLVGMNASGRSPAAAGIESYHSQGCRSMPVRGMLTVTVPGALRGWSDALERHGRLPLAQALDDAVFYAENGFPVTEVISGEWRTAVDLLKAHPESARVYLTGGRAPMPGQVFKNPDLAATYRLIAEKGADEFYNGGLARRIDRFSRQNGGFLRIGDLAAHATQWVEPLSLDYRGYTVMELPPNGQGVTALEILNVLSGYDLAALGHNSPEHLHLLIEAMKLAFSDRNHLVADPDFSRAPLETMLSGEYAASQRKRINPGRAMEPPSCRLAPEASDTVYVAAGDAEGNSASFISSIFNPFGSGMVVDGTGISLHSRGRSFSLDPGKANRLEPGKRPMHTIIPAMLCKGGRFVMSFGVMGADMQPQGHAQFMANLLDFNMNLQEAMDAPRVCLMGGKEIHFEPGIDRRVVEQLEKMGHLADRAPTPANKVGGGQAVYRDSGQGCWLAASDRRKDGCAMGF